MSIVFEEAAKEEIKVHVALIGPSGSGKTYSALELAVGLADGGEIILIDTEKGRGKHYAGRFKYTYLRLDPPFTPERYIEHMAAAYARKPSVVIVDSASHEWIGEGGLIEAKDKMGGKFQDWAKLTPRHNKFISAITGSPCHVIVTLRGKDQYVMTEKDEDGRRGKQEVKKVGVGAQMRDQFEYEFEASFLIDNPTHFASVVKDIDGLFAGTYEVLSRSHGHRLAEWANAGIKSPRRDAEPKPAPAPAHAAPPQSADATTPKEPPRETYLKLDGFITAATTVVELKAAGADIAEAKEACDINEKEVAALKAHYKNKLAKLEPAVPAPATPTTPAAESGAAA